MTDPADLQQAALSIGNRISAEIRAALAKLVRDQVDEDQT